MNTSNNAIAYRSVTSDGDGDASANFINNFNQNVPYANVVQAEVYVCNEQNVLQFLDEYCVKTIQLIIHEMKFYLDMVTYKTTKKHLFNPKNRGEQNILKLINISFGHIETLSLQIVVPFAKLHSTQQKIVLHWMYDECDKLCDQFQSNRLDRSKQFFENMFKNCEEELKEREATQSRAKRLKKGLPTYPKSRQSSHQQSNLNEFEMPPPPYSSPNDTCSSTYFLNSSQPQSHFQVPMARPTQSVQASKFFPPSSGSGHNSGGRPVAQAYIVRPQQTNSVTQSQCMQRPMTAPIRSIATGAQSNVNRDISRNPWSVQSTNPFQQLISSQNTTATNHTYNMVGNQSTTNSIGADSNFQQAFYANNVAYAVPANNQQAMLSSSGFAAAPIERQSVNEMNMVSGNVNNSHKRGASNYLDGVAVAKSSRNESYMNSVAQHEQPQPQYSVEYSGCLTDGTKTPVFRMNVVERNALNVVERNDLNDLNEYIQFNQSALVASSANNQMQASETETTNELATPPKRSNPHPRRIDTIVNDELCLTNADDFDFETMVNEGAIQIFDVDPAEVTVVCEQDEANVLQSNFDTPTSEPMPSMPDLFNESITEETAPEYVDESIAENTEPEVSNEPSAQASTSKVSVEPIVEKTSTDTVDEPNVEELVSDTASERNSTETMENISTKMVLTTPVISNVHSCTAKEFSEISGAPSTSKSIASAKKPFETNEQVAEESDNNDSNRVGDEKDDADCEVVLVETQAKFQPIVKKEEPLDDNENENEAIFKDIPSTRRKCKRYIDLTEDDEDDEDDVLIIDSDEEESVEQKFVSILSAKVNFPPTCAIDRRLIVIAYLPIVSAEISMRRLFAVGFTYLYWMLLSYLLQSGLQSSGKHINTKSDRK